MNTDLQTKLEASADKLIDFLEASGSATIDFAKEQVPLVVEEMLRWGWWSAAMGAAVGVSMLLCFALCLAYIVHRFRKNGEPVFSLFLGAACFLVGIAMVRSNATQMVKITVAPRLYLIDQLKEIAK